MLVTCLSSPPAVWHVLFRFLLSFISVYFSVTQAGDLFCLPLSVYFGDEMHLSKAVQILESQMPVAHLQWDWTPVPPPNPCQFTAVLTGSQAADRKWNCHRDSVEPQSCRAPGVHSWAGNPAIHTEREPRLPQTAWPTGEDFSSNPPGPAGGVCTADKRARLWVLWTYF